MSHEPCHISIVAPDQFIETAQICRETNTRNWEMGYELITSTPGMNEIAVACHPEWMWYLYRYNDRIWMRTVTNEIVMSQCPYHMTDDELKARIARYTLLHNAAQTL
jgi:hypothetical protein